MRRAVIAASSGAADQLVTDINLVLGLPRQLERFEVVRPGGLYTSALPTQSWGKLGTLTVPVNADVMRYAGQLTIPTWAGTKRIEANICYLGDSITVGGDDTSNNGFKLRNNSSLATAGYIPKNVGPYKAGVLTTNNDHSGVAGDTIPDMTARVANDVFPYAPNAVCIYAGTNGIGNPTVDQLARMTTLLQTLYAYVPGAMIVLSKIGPRIDFEAECIAFNAGLAACLAASGYSASRYALVDPGMDAADIAADKVHPLPSGHAKIAAAMLTPLQAYLDEPGPEAEMLAA